MTEVRWHLFQVGVAAAFMAVAYLVSRGMPDQSGFLIVMALVAFFLVCFANRWATIVMDGVLRRREGLPFVDRKKLRAWAIRNSIWWLATIAVALAFASQKGFQIENVAHGFLVAIAFQIFTRIALAIVYFRERPATLDAGIDLAQEPDHDRDRLGRARPMTEDAPEVIEIPSREQPRKLLRPPT